MAQYGHPVHSPNVWGRADSQRIADHIRGSLPKLPKQNLVGLDDAVIRIVRQDDVVDRIERIHPLPLRAQHLLQQTEVLYR